MFLDALTGAEADVLCGADYGQRSDDRVNTRNGYRHRDFDTPRRRTPRSPDRASMARYPRHQH